MCERVTPSVRESLLTAPQMPPSNAGKRKMTEEQIKSYYKKQPALVDSDDESPPCMEARCVVGARSNGIVIGERRPQQVQQPIQPRGQERRGGPFIVDPSDEHARDLLEALNTVDNATPSIVELDTIMCSGDLLDLHDIYT